MATWTQIKAVLDNSDVKYKRHSVSVVRSGEHDPRFTDDPVPGEFQIQAATGS